MEKIYLRKMLLLQAALFCVVHDGMGMTGQEIYVARKIDAAYKQAERTALATGKTAEQARVQARTAARVATDKAQKEVREQYGMPVKKQEKVILRTEEKKDEEKEPEKTAVVPAKQNPVAHHVSLPSSQEKKWANRYEAQKDETVRLSFNFDPELTVRFGNYMVAWDEEQKKDRVFLCSSPTSCSFESEDEIVTYRLQADEWVMTGTIDK